MSVYVALPKRVLYAIKIYLNNIIKKKLLKWVTGYCNRSAVSPSTKER